MKTFKDLSFEEHPMGIDDHKIAKLELGNNFLVSVIIGNTFHSNGEDTYEIAIIKDGSIDHDSLKKGGIIGHLTSEQITNIMEKIQKI